MTCKYFKHCEHASSTSFTCTRGDGGSYCGVFRILAEEQADAGQDLSVCRPLRYIREMLSIC
ncbi:MAG: hypothetical protein JW705_09360 [Methanosarcinaceae archaeon]|nr:hypothetical protein [Methanosarcinaceae archaeon]